MNTMVTPTGDRGSQRPGAERTGHDHPGQDRLVATALRHPDAAVITSARASTSDELSTRVRRYTFAMAFRMACFLAMIVVDGWMRWVLLAVAVFMPYLAVVVANQADQRSAAAVDAVAPEPAPALTVGPIGDVVPGEIIEGSVVEGGVEWSAPRGARAA